MAFVVRQNVKVGTSGGSGVGSATFSGPLTSNTLSGSLLLCVVTTYTTAFQPGAAPVPTINAPVTSGVTWVLATQESCPSAAAGVSSNSAGAVALYYVANASILTNSTNTSVTATASSSNSGFNIDLSLLEITGAATSAFDTTAPGATGLAGTTANAGSLTTAGSGEFIFAVAIALLSPQPTAGSGFTSLGATSSAIGHLEYQIGSGTVTCQFATNTGASWAAIGAAFIPAASGPFAIVDQAPLSTSAVSTSNVRADQIALVVSAPVPPPPAGVCITPIYILAANVDNRLEETDPPIFWSQQLEIYSGLIEAENDLLLLIGRPTQVVNQTIVLAPNSVWQTLPRGIFTLTDMMGPNGPLHKVTLFGMDYEQGPGVTSAWENDTGPYPKRWGPIGFNMFFVHPAPAQAVTVNITAIQYPTTNPWPYTGMEFAPFHDEFFVALEEYAACYARLKETGAEAQEGFALYAEYLSLAQRLTVIEDRRDPVIFSTSFGARSGVVQIKKR